MERLIYTVTHLYLAIRRVIILILRLARSMKHGSKSLLSALLCIGVFVGSCTLSMVQVKAEYINPYPNKTNFTTLLNYANDNEIETFFIYEASNGYVQLIYPDSDDDKSFFIQGSVNTYRLILSNNHWYNYVSYSNLKVTHTQNAIGMSYGGSYTIYRTPGITINPQTSNITFTYIDLEKKPEPTPTPTPVPEPTYEPIETPTPLPTATPYPVITPDPGTYIPGTESQLDYLYLTDFNLIRANRFFLAYGFTDSRYDSWQNNYEESTSGIVNGNFYVQGYENGNLVGTYTYYEYMQLRQNGGMEWVLRMPDAYNIHATVEGMGCKVTEYQGDYEPLEWICSYDDYGDYASGIPGTMDALLVIEPEADDSLVGDALTRYNGLLYMSQVDTGYSFYGNTSGQGQQVATLTETTYENGTSENLVQWNTHSILNVTKRTRIYANVLYSPENLICLNGFSDFEVGNENFQRASKTFRYETDNHPVICSLVYDGAYNASIFSGGVLQYIPWKLVNGEKQYTGTIIPTTRISGGGVVHLAEFTGFQDGDIVGCDINILSGFGSIQPLFVGPYKAIPDEIFAIINGITAGQAQTDQIIETVQQTAQDLTEVNPNNVSADVNSNQSALTTALIEKGYTYPLVQISGLKESLMAVEPVGQIQLPAIFKSGETWTLDLTVVETYLGPLWNFGRGLLYIWLALNIMDMLMDLFNYIADYDQDK